MLDIGLALASPLINMATSDSAMLDARHNGLRSLFAGLHTAARYYTGGRRRASYRAHQNALLPTISAIYGRVAGFSEEARRLKFMPQIGERLRPTFNVAARLIFTDAS